MASPPSPLYFDEDVSVDFERLHREWLEAGKSHAGIIIARRRSPGELAARVGRLLSRLGGEELRNQ